MREHSPQVLSGVGSWRDRRIPAPAVRFSDLCVVAPSIVARSLAVVFRRPFEFLLQKNYQIIDRPHRTDCATVFRNGRTTLSCPPYPLHVPVVRSFFCPGGGVDIGRPSLLRGMCYFPHIIPAHKAEAWLLSPAPQGWLNNPGMRGHWTWQAFPQHSSHTDITDLPLTAVIGKSESSTTGGTNAKGEERRAAR